MSSTPKKRRPQPQKSPAKKSRSGRLFPAAVTLVLLLFTAVLGWRLLQPPDDPGISIDGLAVTGEEFRFFLDQRRLDVVNRLLDQYGGTVDAAFWTTERDGKLPYKILADEALAALKEHRALYEIAQEAGYVDEISFESILRRVEEENRRRAEKLAEGESVYGLSSFTTELFLTYEADNIKLRYCGEAANSGMDIPEESALARYEAWKDTRFSKADAPGDYIPYEDVRDSIVKALREEAFDQLLAERAAGLEMTGSMNGIYRFVEQNVY